MVLQNFVKTTNFIEMTSNMIYIGAFGGGLKCPHKILVHLNFTGTIWTSCKLLWTAVGGRREGGK